MSIGKKFFFVGGAAIALAAFVTLDVTFSDIFDQSFRARLETQLRPLFHEAPSGVVLLLASATVYVIVGTAGGLIGTASYRLFRKLPFLRESSGDDNS